MSITIKKNRTGEITITAKSRKSGRDLRNFVFAMAGEEPPKDEPHPVKSPKKKRDAAEREIAS
jgi:plasmid replication initiation protein